MSTPAVCRACVACMTTTNDLTIDDAGLPRDTSFGKMMFNKDLIQHDCVYATYKRLFLVAIMDEEKVRATRTKAVQTQLDALLDKVEEAYKRCGVDYRICGLEEQLSVVAEIPDLGPVCAELEKLCSEVEKTRERHAAISGATCTYISPEVKCHYQELVAFEQQRNLLLREVRIAGIQSFAKNMMQCIAETMRKLTELGLTKQSNGGITYKIKGVEMNEEKFIQVMCGQLWLNFNKMRCCGRKPQFHEGIAFYDGISLE